ncbi:MAG TPA: hypothetical protein VK174_10125 [Chitinophagales bacterium]|nr:hypothetical protein [Chitinophagales bacterium]
MQKLLSTVAILLAFVAFSFAQQTVASDFYLMKNTHDAEIVLKAIQSELNLSGETYAKVKSLLTASAKSQEEQLALSPDAERINIIKTRQTAHIENALQGILGKAVYSDYLAKKAAIDTQLKDLKLSSSNK